jgi:hypothetical protein
MGTAIRHGENLSSMSDQTDWLAARRLHAQELTLGNVVDVGDGMEIIVGLINHGELGTGNLAFEVASTRL